MFFSVWASWKLNIGFKYLAYIPYFILHLPLFSFQTSDWQSISSRKSFVSSFFPLVPLSGLWPLFTPHHLEICSPICSIAKMHSWIDISINITSLPLSLCRKRPDLQLKISAFSKIHIYHSSNNVFRLLMNRSRLYKASRPLLLEHDTGTLGL